MTDYPLQIPTTPGHVSCQMRLDHLASSSVSPFTRSEQINDLQAAQWVIDISLPPMSRVDAAAWKAFFLKLRGRVGTFLVGESMAREPMGAAPGTPLVDGAGQSGDVLNTRGWTASTADILLPGDYLQVDQAGAARLHMVVETAGSDAAGKAAVKIAPPLRASPPDGTLIITENARGVFRLVDNAPPWATDVTRTTTVSISAREAI